MGRIVGIGMTVDEGLPFVVGDELDQLEFLWE